MSSTLPTIRQARDVELAFVGSRDQQPFQSLSVRRATMVSSAGSSLLDYVRTVLGG